MIQSGDVRCCRSISKCLVGKLQANSLTTKLVGQSVQPNAGLLDQQLALRWVLDHTSTFGGDPQQVIVTEDLFDSILVRLYLTPPKEALPRTHSLV